MRHSHSLEDESRGSQAPTCHWPGASQVAATCPPPSAHVKSQVWPTPDPQHPPPPHAVPSPGGVLAAAPAQKAGHEGPVQNQVPGAEQVHPSHPYEHCCPTTAHGPLGWTAGHAAESARSLPSSPRAPVSAPPSAPTSAVLASRAGLADPF